MTVDFELVFTKINRLKAEQEFDAEIMKLGPNIRFFTRQQLIRMFPERDKWEFTARYEVPEIAKPNFICALSDE